MNLKIIFLTLLFLTSLTFSLHSGTFLVAILILAKIALILFYFMELQHAYRLFLIGISGFILTVSFILCMV